MRQGPPPSSGRLVVERGAGVEGAAYAVLSLAGEFDLTNAHLLREQLDALLAESPAFVVLDLAELEFCDSSILGVLIVAHRQTLAGGTALRLAALPPFLQRLLKITNLDTVIDTFPDVDTAKS